MLGRFRFWSEKSIKSNKIRNRIGPNSGINPYLGKYTQKRPPWDFKIVDVVDRLTLFRVHPKKNSKKEP
jgi:hypothetical protein